LKRDQKFFDMYSLVIGLLAIFAIFIFVLSMKMSDLTSDVYNADTDEFRQTVEARLKPFGEVYMPGQELEAGEPQVPAAQTPAPVATALTGPQVFNQACNVCHGAGIGGAPMLTDTGNWEPRIAQGIDVLISHALGGYSGSAGYMPPKGGNLALSDDEVAAAVRFMVGQVQGE